MGLEGTWEIYEMSGWDADYFNMEVQAYVMVDEAWNGEFQFGLVTGSLDGEMAQFGEGERLEFTWEGADECDEVSGSGWLRLKGEDEVEGRIKFHGGDSSMFLAKRA